MDKETYFSALVVDNFAQVFNMAYCVVCGFYFTKGVPSCSAVANY